MRATALVRLLAWLSPAFPVGAFSYSHGIEWAHHAGDVADAASLHGWVGAILCHGGGRNDAVLLAVAHRATLAADGAALAGAAEVGAALAGAAERRLETLSQGAAFRRAAAAGWPCPVLDRLADLDALPYPVAVGAAAAGHGIEVEDALVAYLHGFAANLVSAGVRLIPLGQTDGITVLAGLEPAVLDIAADAVGATLDDLGGCTLRADLASLHHETQTTRLFRS